MQFRIPASQNEKNAVHDSARELKASLAKSAELAKGLVSLLNDNFLSIDNEYRTEFTKELNKIGGAMWQLNVCIYEMQEWQERVVSAQSENK